MNNNLQDVDPENVNFEPMPQVDVKCVGCGWEGFSEDTDIIEDGLQHYMQCPICKTANIKLL